MNQKKRKSQTFMEVVEKGMKEETKFYTARIDRSFKATLGNEEHQSMLEEFLSRILKQSVRILKYMRNEQVVDSVTEKIKVVDLLVLLEDQRIVHVELNNISAGMLEEVQKRNFIYVASDYVDIVQRGDDYSIETPLIAIDLTYGLGDSAELKEVFYFQNDKGKKYIKDLEMIVVNMDRAMEYWYNKDIKKVQENKHLIMLDCGPEDLKILSEGDELVKEFADNIIKLNTNKKFRQLMTVEEDAAKLDRTMMNKARREGLEEGQTIGQAEIIQSFLDSGMSIEEVSKITKMPVEEIEQKLNINSHNNSNL